jgi:hypothetical protein
MSYVVQIWEQPVPTSVQDADRINSQLHGERCAQNPKFIELVKRLMERYPGLTLDDGESDEACEDVWTDSALDGQCDQPVYGLGVRTEHLDTALPFVFETAAALGLVVYDPQAGEVRLPGSKVLTMPGQAPQSFASPQQAIEPGRLVSVAEAMQIIRQALDPLMSRHGFKAVGAGVSGVTYKKRLKASTDFVAITVKDWLGLGYVELWCTPGIDINLPNKWPKGTRTRLFNYSIRFDTRRLQEQRQVQVADRFFNDFNTSLILRVVSTGEVLDKLGQLANLIERGVLPMMSKMQTLEALDETLNKGDASRLPELRGLVTRFTPITVAYMAHNPELKDIAHRILSEGVYRTTKEAITELLDAVGLQAAQEHEVGGAP